MAYFWAAAVVIFAVAEGITVQLVSIWLCGGALAAMLGAIFGADTTVQLVLFAAVSLVLIVFTRPLAKRLMGGEPERTNNAALIGRLVTVTEEVNNMSSTGKAVMNGIEWSLKSLSGEIYPVGTVVRIEKIEGVKLVVCETETVHA